MTVHGSIRRILASVAAAFVLIGPGVCGAVCGAGAAVVSAPVAEAHAGAAAMPCHAAPEPASEAPVESSERTLPECCEPDFEQSFLSGDPPKPIVRTLQQSWLPTQRNTQGADAASARHAASVAPPLLPDASAYARANPPLLI